MLPTKLVGLGFKDHSLVNIEDLDIYERNAARLPW